MSELTNIQILRSAVPHKRPDPSFLLDGQLAINYKEDDPGLFAKLQSGGLFKIGPASYTTDGTAPNQNPGVGGIAGNSVGEEWNDGRGAFYSPIKKFWNGTAWQTLGGWDVDNGTGALTCLKAINISTLTADAIQVNGPAIIDGDVTPNGTSCIHDLGKANERWKGAYFCELDLQGDLSLGGDLTVGGTGSFGGSLSTGGDLDVIGSATFGQSCAQGKFTVKMPTYLNCDVQVLGDITGRSLNLSQDLKVEGNVDFGKGCGLSATHFYNDVTFHCDVNFITYPLTVESLIVTDLFESQGNSVFGTNCATDTSIFNSKITANCVNEFLGDTQVGKVGGFTPQFTTYGPNFFYEDLESDKGLILAAKGFSAPTVDTDPDNTMITKKWTEDMVASSVLNGGIWEQTGAAVNIRTVNGVVIPNGPSSAIGLPSNRWPAVRSIDLDASGNVQLGGNCATSTITLFGNTILKCNLSPDQDGAHSIGTPASHLGSIYVDNIYTDGNVSLGSGCNTSTVELKGSTIVHCDVLPATDNTINLGSSFNRFANIYTGDLHLKNDRGDWTLIEEEDVLTMRNNKTGKRYAIMMTPYEG